MPFELSALVKILVDVQQSRVQDRMPGGRLASRNEVPQEVLDGGAFSSSFFSLCGLLFVVYFSGPA
ncbi:uncharacterized protein SCHCODRAFT_02645132 [Schizophyllum commune H4-8]|uniref:uncharacterized protein n=1 Tax=Schizophyllum commune (strain H4-8 / FGSC 9210) TaxID=578458 RepID=UPI00215F3EFA|nr:uncharacterized protein SCHCODRAFT_02645132 [Schizophyllum commune H4-8]KAI5885111.1 hypothetical protein SCHCODRAFT_02645132 [Schizophyllum commune H4-8]